MRRLKGSHTADVLAEVLSDIHSEFGIRRKIVKTTTDNGSNFVKAFSVFGPAATASSDDEDDDNDDPEAEGESTNDADTEMLDVTASFNDNNPQECELPPHQRCACHTLNLVSTSDADKAEKDLAYKKVSRGAFAKCQGLWNKYGRSSLAADAVIDSYGLGLKKPNQTRWNSVFMAVERLVRLINEHGEDSFHSLCSKLDLPKLTGIELTFLMEYVAVMKPLAQALNILQSESNMFMGYLLPTICILRQKLMAKQATSTTCKPLVAALISGINERFNYLFDDSEAVAAAILHPKFRTSWTDNQQTIQKGLQMIKDLLSTMSVSATPDTSGSESLDDDEAAFFSTSKTRSANQNILEQYLSSQSDETCSVAAWPALKELFIRLNTPLPASAAVERLFSCAGLTMNKKRTRLSDDLFENLVFLKKNNSLSSE